MQAEKFLEMLSQTDRLDKGIEEQLRQLAEKFPYSQPLRILLAKNLQQLQRSDFEKQVNQAAACAIDRKQFQVFISGRIKPVVMPTPVPEIEKPANKKERTSFFPAWFVQLFLKKKTPATLVNAATVPDKTDEKTHEAKTAGKEDTRSQSVEKPCETAIRKHDALIEKFLKEEPRIKPTRGSNFNENLAEKNLLSPEEIGTETLAMIFLNQGLHEKALDIYQKLSLRFPEKSSYFAEKINTIKNEINLKK